jgi:hypothetical protein
MIFLSDGECSVPNAAIQNVCQSAVQLGYVFIDNAVHANKSFIMWCRQPLSFHSVSFGPDSASSLRRMAKLALEIQNNVLSNHLRSAAKSIPSTFTTALDTVRKPISPGMIRKSHHRDVDITQVQLAATFSGIAESLRKPRGSLMHWP